MKPLASVLTLTVAALVALPTSAYAAAPPDLGAGDIGDDTGYTVEATRSHHPSTNAHSNAERAGDSPVVEYAHATGCELRAYNYNWAPGCETQGDVERPCPDGSIAQEPIFSRIQNDDGTWGLWELVSWYTCPDNTNALLAAIEHEWATLSPAPTTATLQPDTDWVYANVPTIALADYAPITHAATLLGENVQIRATPANFTWAWGDGETTVTDDPGTPYPNQTLTHTYAHQDGDVTVTLATSWYGKYRIGGGQWTDFTTAITSHTPPITLEVRNPHSQLVACDTHGNCR